MVDNLVRGSGNQVRAWGNQRGPIPRPHRLVSQHGTTAVSTVSVRPREGDERPVAQHLGRSEGQAGEDDAFQVGYRKFKVFSRWRCSGV